MKLLLGFWLGIAAVLLEGAAWQLSPVDQQQNERLATIEVYLWGTPTQEFLPPPMTATPTFRPGTNTYTPTRTTTPALPTSTFVPTTPAPTATTVLLPTPTSTEMPPMVRAGNVSGVTRWVRLCPGLNCEIVARVAPGEIVAVNPQIIVEADGYRFIALWNGSGWVAFQEIATGIRYLQW